MRVHSLLGIARALFVAATWVLPLAVWAQATVSTDIRPSGWSAVNTKVNSSGNLEVSFPIRSVPGTAGMEPNISLAYNSDAGNGQVGVGWSIGGLSSISRCPRTIATDGVSAAVWFQASDRFCLDGQRLIAVSGIEGGDQTEYRTEVESDTKVISYGTAGSGPAYFRVWSRDGRIQEYGNSVSSRVEVPGSATVRLWTLTRVQDRKGNYLEVTYLKNAVDGEVAPSRIDYSGYSGSGGAGRAPYASVRFEYFGGRSDIEELFVNGVKLRSSLRLTNVKTFLGEGLVRDYRLTYEPPSSSTGRSRISSITECDSTGGCLPSTSFGWTAPATTLNASAQQTPLQYRGGTAGNAFVTSGAFLDVNGDGRADFCTDEMEGNNVYTRTVRCLYAASGGWTVGIQSEVFNNATQLMGSWVDFNGDGLLDFCTISQDNPAVAPTNNVNSRVRCRINAGTSFSATHVLSPVIDYGTVTVSTPAGNRTTIQAWWGDFNGDGRDDFCRTTSHPSQPQRLHCNYSLGASFGPTVDLGPSTGVGKILGGGDRPRMLCYGWGSTAPKCSQIVAGVVQPPYSLTMTGMTHQVSGDLNGDGIPDTCGLTGVANNTDSVLTCFLGTGAGWVQVPATIPLGQRYPSMMTFVDINADRKEDLCWSVTGPAGTLPSLRCLLSKGNQFESSVAVSINSAGHGGRWGDFNGDGVSDYCTLWRETSGAEYMNCWTSPVGARDVLASLTDGMGAKSEWSLLPMSSSVHTKGQARPYPSVNTVSTAYLVSQSRLDNGIGGLFVRDYKYQGFRRDQLGRGQLGFELITATDTSTGVVSETTYLQDYPFVGLVQRQRALHGRRANVVLHDETTNWASSSLGGSRYRLFYDGGTTKTWDANSAFLLDRRSTVLSRDDFGNATQTESRFYSADGTPDGYVQLTTRSFRTDTQAWLFGLLTSTSTRVQLADGRQLTRTASSDYDADGYPFEVVVEPNNAGLPGVTNLRSRTQIGYDAYGNRATLTVSGANIATRAIIYTFEERGRFVSRIDYPHGLSHGFETDPRFGVVTRFLDANSVPTTVETDGFGDVKHVRYADGTRLDVSRRRCSGCWKSSVAYTEVSKIVESTGARVAPLKRTYIDRLGREILALSESFDGRLSHTEAEFDALGKRYRQSKPYFWGETASWSYFEYRDDAGLEDPFGRVSKATEPNGRVVSKLWNGLTSVVTAARDGVSNYTTRTERNSRGQILRQVSAEGTSDESRVSYTYAPFGELATVTDSLGNIVRHEYDILGRHISTIDPNAGRWVYTYNELSELTGQTDARNQPISFSYDLLGRPTQRLSPDSLYRWTYDTCTNGKGLLCQVTSPAGSGGNGYSRSYSYDQFGRNSGIVTTADTSYSMGFAYDGAGRLSQITYPTGFAIRREYGTGGFVSAIRNAANNALIWQPIALTASGEVKDSSFGNGVASSVDIDPRTDLATGIRVRTGPYSANILNWSQTYDLAGNTLSRSDTVSGLNETFRYDNLDRLVRAEPQGGTTKTISYNAIGNVLAKSDVGTFAYPVSGPNSVRPAAVASVSGTVNGVVSPSYAYDANGNMTSGAGRTATWSAENLPKTVAGNGKAFSWLYDDAGQRIQESVLQGGVTTTTYYIGGALEKEVTGTATEYRHLIEGDQGTVAIFVSRSDGTTSMRYVHRDPLGSPVVTTDHSGMVVERLGFDAFGARRGPNGSDVFAGQLLSGRRAFTDHVQLDTGLVHMNGRLYDAALNRFFSPDPLSNAADGQNLNGYAYVAGRPLKATDPTGLAAVVLKRNSAFESAPEMTGDFFIVVGDLANGGAIFNSPTGEYWVDNKGCVHMPGASLIHQSAYVYTMTMLEQQERNYLTAQEIAARGGINGALGAKHVSGPSAYDGIKGVLSSPVGGSNATQDNGPPRIRVPDHKAIIGDFFLFTTTSAIPLPVKWIGKTWESFRNGRKMAAVVKKGKEGEAAVKATNEIGPKVKLTINGRVRYPDGYKVGEKLSEIKNVKRQAYTRQIRDYLDHALDEQLEMHLYLPASATVTRPLQKAIDAGLIKRMDIP